MKAALSSVCHVWIKETAFSATAEGDSADSVNICAHRRFSEEGGASKRVCNSPLKGVFSSVESWGMDMEGSDALQLQMTVICLKYRARARLSSDRSGKSAVFAAAHPLGLAARCLKEKGGIGHARDHVVT
jgi:hypothetical protein